MAVAIAHYYFCSVTGGVVPLLFSANRDSDRDAFFKVAVAHLWFYAKTRGDNESYICTQCCQLVRM